MTSLTSRYKDLCIDYTQIRTLDALCSTLLWIADQEGFIEYIGRQETGHYLLFISGKPRLLQPLEVPGYVLALFDQRGLDVEPVAYRFGLVRDRDE
jgi:hypothetical protein